MNDAIHPALIRNNVAVITGGADGIGLAIAMKLATLGLKLVLADISAEKLETAASELTSAGGVAAADVMTRVTDVADLASVEALRDETLSRFGQVDVLINNAGTSGRNGAFSDYAVWQRIINTNLWGMINGVHSFLPVMVAQQRPGLVINTGSKQGITAPPGNPAYNVSKGGIKMVTEALAHELRNTPDADISVHLLIPGFTYTGMMKQVMAEKPADAWWPEQVADFMLESLQRGDFYILCPDNAVP
ncbi:MAG: SDR family NAD(P)-dependent oxidoreductase, partial [Pseudomonadales bacterium]|nr:SDR family NAD(P)-dependent oxidoreductase [Pseudomonadales bacterium]